MQETRDSQPEDLWSITGLNTVSFALSCVPSNDTEIRACDGEDCTTVFTVRVELPTLRRSWHDYNMSGIIGYSVVRSGDLSGEERVKSKRRVSL